MRLACFLIAFPSPQAYNACKAKAFTGRRQAGKGRNAMYKLILLDLDGTLLRSDKTISGRTVSALSECRKRGYLVGVSTARGESNASQYIGQIVPELVISSGGALVRFGEDILYCAAFGPEETRKIIDAGFELTQGQCEITVDTLDAHYWNYKEDPHILSPDWGDVRYTDYRDFSLPSLKISIELPGKDLAEEIARRADCDWARFSDGNWYKFSRRDATKEKAIGQITAALGISADEILAFGDDYVDLGMLAVSGTGVAMGNAIPEVKQAADAVTGSNDEDGVAVYLEENLL